MQTSHDSDHADDCADFARQASASQDGFITELWLFLRWNKKWWLTPIVLILLLVGVLAFLGGSPAAQFIYALF